MWFRSLMAMGNVMSRLAVILRRKKVSPNQEIPVQQNPERFDNTEFKDRNEPATQQGFIQASTIQEASVGQRGEIPNAHHDSSEFGGSSSLIRTAVPDSVTRKTAENDFTQKFCDPKIDSEVRNGSKSSQNGSIFCANIKNKEALYPTGQLSKSAEDLHVTMRSKSENSTENHLNIGRHSSCKVNYDLLSQDIEEQEGELDALSCKDGYSTEGTAGTDEGSFGDRDNDIIDELLVDNIDDVDMDEENFDTIEPEITNGRKSALTPLSLETFNTCEVDRRESVRSYIQAWSPLNLPTAGAYSNSLPGARAEVLYHQTRTPEPDDRSRCIYDVLDHPQEIGLFFQRSSEPVPRSSACSREHLKNDRAPWIRIGPTGTEEVIQGREKFTCDEEDSGWRETRGEDPNNRLTLCSLSTINEESEDTDRIDNL